MLREEHLINMSKGQILSENRTRLRMKVALAQYDLTEKEHLKHNTLLKVESKTANDPSAQTISIIAKSLDSNN